MFVLNSEVTIGKFRFSGVNSIHIRRSVHSIVETAVISIPSIAKIIRNGKVDAGIMITGKQFSEGDPVVIKLGYNNDLRNEFRGFVKRRNLKMPLEVECEGYSWQLRRNSINKFWPTVSLKELLNKAVSNIDSSYAISVQCEVDLHFTNIKIDKKSAFDVIENISKYTDSNVSCFFIKPDLLWCGLLYSDCANNKPLHTGDVKYRLGFNVIKDNALTERIVEDSSTKVEYNARQTNGSKISASSEVHKSFTSIHSKQLSKLKDEPGLKKLAAEKALKLNYAGYEGYINTFLQPYAEPGYTSYITDSRYPERDSNYLVESTEVQYGISGARRKIEIGPRFGSAK